MPRAQLHEVVARNWGRQWASQFESFNEQPFAAASIGQVHEAINRKGRRLAIKVQYPGIAASIDSDIDNVAKLLRLVQTIASGA